MCKTIPNERFIIHNFPVVQIFVYIFQSMPSISKGVTERVKRNGMSRLDHRARSSLYLVPRCVCVLLPSASLTVFLCFLCTHLIICPAPTTIARNTLLLDNHSTFINFAANELVSQHATSTKQTRTWPAATSTVIWPRSLNLRSRAAATNAPTSAIP